MAEDIKVFLPKLGESILSANVVRWFKKEGEEVLIDEPLLEVTTDKINTEIPSPSSGILKKIFANEGEELKVGDLLAIIEVREQMKKEERSAPQQASSLPKESSFDEKFISPAAKELIKKHALSQEEVKTIPRTGTGGRLSRNDVETHMKNRYLSCPIDKVKMSPVRKSIAKNMAKSFSDIPSASLIIEVDVTNVLKKINLIKEEFLKENGCKITISSYVAKAISKAATNFPFINASLSDDTILVKKEVNLGIAVSVHEGLVVPVIKNCDSKTIKQIALEISSLGEKARTNNLSVENIQDGTITMSNFGMGGALIGIPIIKHPEVAIIGIGAIQRRVVPKDDNTFTVREMMMISLTFDHRIIDGMYGCSFVSEIKNYLEKADME